MNLRKLKFWDRSNTNESAAETVNQTAVSPIASGTEGNVYSFGAHSDLLGLGVSQAIEDDASRAAADKRNSLPRGLLAEDDLRAFLKNNYFCLGQHNGLNFQSAEAEELGKDTIVSRFINVVETLIEKRKSRISQLNHSVIQVGKQASVVSLQLENLKNELSREIELLERQATLASERKGWVLQALNLYQLGFAKGVREAIDTEIFFK